MVETAFIRSTNAKYNQRCDFAHVPLVAVVDGVFGTEVVAYLGTVKGKHRPSSCITWKWIDADGVWGWVNSKGYARDPASIPGPKSF